MTTADAANPLRATLATAGAATLVTLAAINATDYAVSAAVSTLAPNIEHSLHLSDAGLLGVVAVTGLAFALAAVPVGLISDRTARPKVTGLTSLVAGLSTVATAFVGGGGQFALSRVATGAGQSAIQSTHLPLLADTYPLSARQRVYAVHSAMPNVGSIVGPLLAGGLAALIGGPDSWRWPLGVLGVLTVALGLLALRLREPGRAQQETLDGTPVPVSQLELGPSVRALLRIRSLALLLGALAVSGASLLAIPSLLSLYLERVQHQGSTSRGLLAALAAAAATAGLAVGAPLGERLLGQSPRLVARLLAVALLVSAVIEAAAIQSQRLLVVAAGFTVATFFGSLVTVPLYSTVTAAVPPRLRSLAFALIGLAVVVGGGALGSGVGGAISDSYGTVTAITAVLLITTPVAALLALGAAESVEGDIAEVERELLDLATPRDARALIPTLELRRVRVAYGDTLVVPSLDLTLQRGQVLALLGTNGAGKSTILRAISGLQPLAGGRLFLDGRDISDLDPAARVRAGIVQVMGGRAIFPQLTVLENLLAATFTFGWDRRRQRAELERVLRLFPALPPRLGQRAGLLSGGEQQMLALAKALVLRPSVLLIDELSLGLAPAVVRDLLTVVADVARQDVAVVIVEQSLTTALQVADRAVFLERGRLRFDGDPVELAGRGDLARAVFLGAVGG